MSSYQKPTRKGDHLDQYRSLVEKWENVNANSKSRLRKDNSTSSFTKETNKDILNYTKNTTGSAYKEPQRPLNPSSLYKTPNNPDRQKIIISDKNNTKPPQERFQSTLESVKKSKPNDDRQVVNNYLSDSLANSAISKKWPTENAEQKENISFTAKEEKAFTEHCTQLYRLRASPSLVQDITCEINKRDEVYQLVAGRFPQCPAQKYGQALQAYFQEHELMERILKQFKAISKLQTEDLNELYYFLKTDR